MRPKLEIYGVNYLIAETLPKLPLMYIEVSSVDAWERYRLEGYGYTAIPSAPGKHTGMFFFYFYTCAVQQ